MNKERMKSMTLGCLIVMNFVLGGIILTDKKLWPHGYNFFISMENSYPVQFFANLINRMDVEPAAKLQLSMPENMIINTGYQTTRFSLNTNDPKFSELSNAASSIIAEALSSAAEPQEVSREEWNSALTAKSVYLSYPVDYEAGLFARFMGVKRQNLPAEIERLSKIALSTTDQVAVYIADSGTDKYYKIQTKSTPEPLLELISEYQATSDASVAAPAVINYSFDLGFDRAFGEQKVLLSPMIPIYSNPQRAEILTVSNPLMGANGQQDDVTINRILKAFDINPNTVRRYPEENGTLVFVENNGILKISTQGLLTYKAKGDGILLSRSGSAYDTIGEVADLVDAVSNAAFSERMLYVSSPLDEKEKIITFDYRAAGLPVKLRGNIIDHAVIVEVENGRLIRYEQLLRTYTPTGQVIESPAYINTLDEAIVQYAASMNEIVIDKMYLCYADTGAVPLLTSDWAVEVQSVVIKE